MPHRLSLAVAAPVQSAGPGALCCFSRCMLCDGQILADLLVHPSVASICYMRWQLVSHLVQLVSHLDGCRSVHKDLSPCWESVHKDLTSTLCEDTIVASMLLLYGAGRSMLLLTLLRSSRCMLLLLTLECHACVLQPAVVTLMPTPMWIMNSSLHSETNATCPAALLHCEPTLTLLPRIGQRCYDQVAFLLLPPLLPCLAANYDHEPYVFTEMTVQSPGTAPWLADGTGERVSCPSRLILA